MNWRENNQVEERVVLVVEMVKNYFCGLLWV